MCTAEQMNSWKPSHWWIIAVVVALLLIALGAVLTYLNMKGSFATPRKQLEQPTEMHSVKVSTPAEMNPGGETSPLTGPDTQRQTTDTPSGET